MRFPGSRLTLGAILILPLTAFSAVACGGDYGSSGGNNFPNPTTADVKIVQNAQGRTTTAYNPNPFTVALNGNPSVTVVFGNDDAVDHTVTEDGGAPSFDSGTMNAGDTFSHDFTAAGDYTYHCAIHVNMIGTVHVDP